MDETTDAGPINNPEVPQDNTEEVLFSPQVDTGYGLKEVSINGRTITIHETHRLRDVLAAHMQPSVMHPTTQARLEQYSEIYEPRIKTGQFEGIFNRLNQEYPRLYTQVEHLINDFYAELDEKNQVAEQFGRDSAQFGQTVDKWRKSEDEVNLREYFYSKFFDALAIIGPEIDLEAPLSMLCED